jgi:LacI family transcriptional regulator
LIVTSSSRVETSRPWLVTERLRLGFEEQMARLGGSSLFLDTDSARRHVADRNLPQLAGLFAVSSDPGIDIDLGLDRKLPRTRVSPYPISRRSAGLVVDTVHMDNVDGGRQATQHLVQHGHRNIAFLGLQAPEDESLLYRWSTLRERGWREAMRQIGVPTDDMSFAPSVAPKRYSDEIAAAQDAAEPIVRRRDITAVVCANDNAAMGLLAAMRAAGVPPRSWPSVVGFDGLPEARATVLTSMRLPWEDIGKAGAQFLWDRVQAGFVGGPRHLEVPMMLVSRIGPHKDWSSQVDAEALIRGASQ